MRQFVRIATNLSLTAGTYATDIPKFDPLGSSPKRTASATSKQRPRSPTPTCRWSSATSPPSPWTRTRRASRTTTSRRCSRRSAAHGRRRPASCRPDPGAADALAPAAARTPSATLGYAGITEAPFNSIEVRVVPENVTNLPPPRSGRRTRRSRSATSPSRRARPSRLSCAVSRRRAGSGPVDHRGARRGESGQPSRGPAHPHADRPGPRPGDGRQVVRVILFGERGVEAIAATNDRGLFVVGDAARGRCDGRNCRRGRREEEDDERGRRSPL